MLLDIPGVLEVGVVQGLIWRGRCKEGNWEKSGWQGRKGSHKGRPGMSGFQPLPEGNMLMRRTRTWEPCAWHALPLPSCVPTWKSVSSLSLSVAATTSFTGLLALIFKMYVKPHLAGWLLSHPQKAVSKCHFPSPPWYSLCFPKRHGRYTLGNWTWQWIPSFFSSPNLLEPLLC